MTSRSQVWRAFSDGVWSDVPLRLAGFDGDASGLLAAPQTSFEEGFKASLDVPQLRALALRMEAWWEAEHGLPLRVPAVQFAARHTAVGTVAIGCRTAQEVNECCDAVLAPIPERAWDDFEAAFADDLRGFKREWHWYYDKETTEL